MLGKLITHEFAFGIQFPGHRFPAAKNPWDLERMPGGSSSGSGTALASGLAFARSARTRGARSAALRRSAASRASSRPTAAAAAPAS